MSDIYLYIHIPFCYRKCPYCNFVSFERKLNLVSDYVEAIKKEINSFYTSKTVKTIYFGGGTPSVLRIFQIESILETIYKRFSCDINEITFELIPIAKLDYLKALKGAGVTRLSIGVQSFVQRKLEILGRVHTVKDNFIILENALKAGFENVSIDIMYGLRETKEEFLRDLECIKRIPVTHVSTYMLSVEENTAFYRNNFAPSSDEEIEFFYLTLCDRLPAMGFLQYEISNFAYPGSKSIHNCAYWSGCEYKGFGVSASSFVNLKRIKNTEILENYIQNPKGSFIIEEVLTTDEFAKELLVLGLRRKAGVSLKQIKEISGFDINNLVIDKIKYFVDMGFFEFDGDIVKFRSPKAMLVSNLILSEFI